MLNNLQKYLLAVSVAGALGLAGTPASAHIATDATFGSFDASSGTRALTIVDSVVVPITDVDISIVFAKCDDPSLGAGGGTVGNRCIGTGFSFDNEIAFSLSHLNPFTSVTTTVNLVTAGYFAGQTPGAGVVRLIFDDEAPSALPTLLPGGTNTFRPVSSLTAFDQSLSVPLTDARGIWTLTITDTVSQDRLDYFSSCLRINNQSGCVGTNAVPEPISIALFGMGLAGIAFTRRKTANRDSKVN